MPVAGDHLGGDGSGLQAQFGADLLFGSGPDMGKYAHGSGDLAVPDLFGGEVEPFEVAADFVVVEGEFPAEGDRFGLNAVGAADLGGVTELEGPFLEGCGQGFQRFTDQAGGLDDLAGLGGIDDVVGSHSVVEPARSLRNSLGFHGFGDRRGESNDVVLDLALDLEDSRDGEGGMFAQLAGGLRGDDALIGESSARCEFDFQPLLVLVLITPDGAHCGAGIAGNHRLPHLNTLRGPRGGGCSIIGL